MKKISKSILMAMGLMLFLISPPVFARGGGGHGGGHASSSHASASHASAAHASAAHASATHASEAHAASHVSASHASESVAHTSTQMNHSMTDASKVSTLHNYYGNNINRQFHPNLLYYWTYASMINHPHSSNNEKVTPPIQKYGKTYWINVGDKTINVPESIYNKIKVGDKLTYESPTKLKINGKSYAIPKN